MRGRAVIVVLVALLAWPAAASAWSPGPARYAVSAPTEVRVRMSDGVELAADLYVPTDPATGQPASGRFPVILAQTPYGKRGAITTKGSGSSATGGDGFYPYLVERGYVNAVVDVRGSGASQGAFELFGPREVRDGVELVDWASRLPGTTGAVGAAGESYLGLNQLLTAASVGPGSPLKAIFPVTAGNDLYRDISFGGGIPNTEFAGVFAALRAGMIASDPAQAVSRTGDYAALDGALYSEIDAGGPRAYDGPFWQARSPRGILAEVVANGVPAFLLSGWFDVYQRGATLNFAALQNAWAGRRDTGAPMGRRQPVTGRYQLAMGPWFHNPAALGERLQELQLEWFDSWLKGEATGMDRTRTPLHVFELGPNRWVDAARYPLPAAPVRRFWLAEAGTLAAGPPDAAAGADTLPWTATASPCQRATDQWNTGLASYVAALAGAPAPACTNDDATTQAGAITYTTGPLRRAVTLAGPVAATIYATSTTRDAELVVTLSDVAPDGSSYPLTGGALLGSLRSLDARRSWRVGGRLVLPWHPYSRATRRDVEPGRTQRFDVEVYPTFARLAGGHRLRLTVASGAPHLAPTPAQLPALAGGSYALQRRAGAASHVNVPLADPGALTPSATSYGPCNGGCRP